MVFNSDTMGFHRDLIEFGVQHPCWLMIVGDIHYPILLGRDYNDPRGDQMVY